MSKKYIFSPPWRLHAKRDNFTVFLKSAHAVLLVCLCTHIYLKVWANESDIVCHTSGAVFCVQMLGPFGPTGSCCTHMASLSPRVADRGDGLQIWRVAANILNKQSRTADSGWSSSLGVGRWANNPSP
jgi:hypothetical protein